MSVCPRCGEENAGDARFCSICGTPLAPPPAASGEVRKVVTVVFCDLVDSSRIGAQLDPESHRRIMARWFEAMRAALERHGGTVEKFIGDAVMAVFGIPVLHEDDALRAVKAAVEMRESLHDLNAGLRRDWGLEVAIRLGVNTGEVVTDNAADGETLVTGSAVVIAKRLEETAATGEIRLGESTHRLVKDGVVSEPLGRVAAKGTSDLAAWRLLEVLRGAEATPLRLDSPLVGRERDVAALQETFERVAAERSCGLFTVLGAAGIGKSRLVHEFARWLGGRATVFRGRCLSYGEGITFWPLVEIVKQAAGLNERDSPDETRRKIASLVNFRDDSALIAEGVAAAIGRGDPGAARPEETFFAVRRLFEGLAHDRPLVIVLDDIQWAESTLLDLVEYVAGWVSTAPVMLCCIGRPELLELRPSWSVPKQNSAVILLQPLRAEETDELVTNLLGRLPLAEDAQARIAAAAEGNPLFVEELVRMLLDEGILLRQNGGWRATTDLGALAVPPTIQALLSARLDRLEPEERAVIQRASVAGQVFWWGAVAELSPESARPAVGARLQSLVRKELIKRDHSAFVADDAFRFGHILIRDAAYAALSKESRANLHERFAGWLERKAEDRASEYEELVGYHLEQAYRYRTELAVLDDRTRELAPRAGRRLSSAGVRALARGDIAAGRSLLARAVALLPADGPEQLALQPKLALAYKESGELNEAENVLREARRDAASAGNQEVELNVLVEQAALYLVSRGIWPDRLLTTVEEAIPSLEELGDDPALAKAWHVIGLGRGLWSGSFAVGEVALERALTHARRAKDRRQEAEILAQLAFAAWAGPTPVDQALRRCEQILEGAEGHPTIEAGALRSLAALEARQGRFAGSRSLLGRARRTYDELGMRLFSVAVGAFGYGDVEILAGDFEAAERALRDGYSTLEQMGEKAYVCSVAGYLGGVLYRQGRYEEAERFTSICEQEASPEDIWSQVLFRVTQAKIVARRGDCEQGEALSAEAVNLASMTDIPDLRAGALLDRAETLSLCGRRKEGTPLIEDALGVYEAKGNVVAAKAARAVLRDVLSR